MSTSIKSISEINNLDLPATVYKYRSWNNDSHKNILFKREVYFAKPSQFEDELDCKFPIRWDLLTDEQILSKYFNESLIQNSSYSLKEHMAFAMHWLQNSPIKNKDFLEAEAQYQAKQFDEKIGVLSLTANSSNDEMWDKYGDLGRGICVGFDPVLMFQQFGGGGIVHYVKEIPVIFPTPYHSYDEQNFLQVYNKLDKWSFEEEYRTIIFNINNLSSKQRIKRIPSEAYKHIILGPKMPSENKQELKGIIQKNYPKITLEEA